ncbi:hypothetical protein HT747_19600 [Brevibacillus borstelensis]|uniref:hypothetical protein n=1 Tax=Brevibacillus borstelensis TaxID=45462 RepID=UPI00156263DB|nr:hypothetical protein [Brevibacillus borstelensis]MBE5397346.1 hypothetical protein [Brevibacillus borstelensis]
MLDITHAVMEQVLDRQAALLRRSEEVYRTLTTMVLENSGLRFPCLSWPFLAVLGLPVCWRAEAAANYA